MHVFLLFKALDPLARIFFSANNISMYIMIIIRDIISTDKDLVIITNTGCHKKGILYWTSSLVQFKASKIYPNLLLMSD